MGETQPYKVIGLRLRRLRERAKESLLEVSGAVEIDTAALEEIESGYKLPEEEVLMLLMNHFDVSDSESVKLWELAGYSQESDKGAQTEEQLLKQIMMVIPFDNKVAFTDNAVIEANKNGVVINFSLSNGAQQQSVARVGMSVEAAQQLVMKLAEQLQLAKQPKIIHAIPAKTIRKQTEKKNNS